MESSENYTTKKKVPFGIYLVLLLNSMLVFFFFAAFLEVVEDFKRSSPHILDWAIVLFFFIFFTGLVIWISIGLLRGNEEARKGMAGFSGIIAGISIYVTLLFASRAGRVFFEQYIPLIIFSAVAIYLHFNKKVRGYFSQNEK